MGSQVGGFEAPIQILVPGAPPLRLAGRYLRFVLREPLLERLQRWIEPSRKRNVAGAAENLLKIALELKHVGEIPCTREPEASVRVRRHGVVMNLLPDRLCQAFRHFRAGQMLASDPDGLSNEFSTPLEDLVRGSADVLDC